MKLKIEIEIDTQEDSAELEEIFSAIEQLRTAYQLAKEEEKDE